MLRTRNNRTAVGARCVRERATVHGGRCYEPRALVVCKVQNVVACLKMTNTSTNWIVPLRLVIGFGFAAHGYAKLSRGPANFGRILDSLGVPDPTLVAWLTSLIELMGGVSVMLGAFVVPLAVPLSIIMLTAMFKVHLQYGFSSIRLKTVTDAGAEFGPIGYELNLLYIVGLIAVALIGPARLSVDYFIHRSHRRHRQSA